MTTIVFKTKESLKKFNDLLVAKLPEEGENSLSEQEIFCVYDDDLAAIVDSINNNPSHQLSHMKKNGQDFTIEELQSSFSCYKYSNAFCFDVYFDRTKSDVIELIFDMCLEHIEEIESVYDMRIAYERCMCPEVKKIGYHVLHSISDETFIPVINEKRTVAKEYNKKGSTTLYKPEANVLKYDNNYETCKVNFIFANVKEPKYVLDDMYTDDNFNRPFVDDNNEVYCLLPLLPFSNNTERLLESFYRNLNQYVVKTKISFSAFASLIYNVVLNIDNFKDIEMSLDEAKALLKQNYTYIYLSNKSKVRVESIKRTGVPVLTDCYSSDNTKMQLMTFSLAKIRQYNKKEVYKLLHIDSYVSNI